MKKMLYFCLLLRFTFPCICGDEAILKENLRQVRERGISIVPLPKRIEFTAPVYPEKVVIVANKQQPYFDIICEELQSRFEELKSPVKVSVSDKVEPGLYNIIIKSDFQKPSGLPRLADGCGDELYTLVPFKEGIELSGTKNALYAAVTLRHLIDVKEGRTVIHQAKVTDWPDFPVRAISLDEPYSRRFAMQPEKYAEYIKPLVQRLLRLKINEIRGLPQMPYARATTSRLRSEGPFMNEKARESMRRLCELASERGMNCGMLFTNFCLGTKADENDPEFKGMSRVSWNGELHSWARTDLYAQKCTRFNEFLKQAGWNILFIHSVDSGGSRDPEEWSFRDEATRKRFGDDRAAADVAVFMEHYKAMEGTKVKKLNIVVYPYHGCYMDKGFVMDSLKLPRTPEGEKVAEANVRRDIAYLNRMHSLMPKENVTFCLREGPREQMRLFTSKLPGRIVDIYWEAANSWRDVLPLVPPELLSTGSGFEPERNGQNHIWIPDGGTVKEPQRVAFAERSWNSLGEYYTDIDRSRNPLSYDPESLKFLARRTAEGIWGVELGAKLYPLFDNMLSLHYAVAPFKLKKMCKSDFDLEKYLEYNDTQIHKALDAFEKVWKNRAEEKFKSGSYPQFVEFYRMLKVATVYSGANLAIIRINRAAVKGDQTGIEKIYKQALANIAAGEKMFREFSDELASEPWLTEQNDLVKWDKIGPARLSVNLLVPDFKELTKQLSDAESGAAKLFAEANAPAFLKTVSTRNKTLYAVPENSKSARIVRHWYDSKNLFLRSTPVEATLYRIPEGLRVEASVFIAGIENAKGERLAFDRFPAGDSFELFLALPDAPYTKYQFVADPFGTLYSVRHTGKPGAMFEAFDSGVTPKVVREKDTWKLVLDIPFTVLEAKPGKGWKCMMAVNGKDGSFSSSFVDGKGFHDTSKWQELQFLNNAPQPETGLNDVSFEANIEEMEDRLHTSGSGTWIRFKPAFNTAVPVHVDYLKVQLTDANGGALSDVITLLENRFVSARYQGFEPISLQLENSHKGVVLQFTARYSVDGQSFESKYSIPAGKLEDSVSGNEHRWPFESPRMLDMRQGRIEFAFKPDWEGRSVTSGPLMLMHAGPANKTFNWGGTITVTYNRMWQSLNFRIVTDKYETRSVDVSLPLKRDVWRHLALEWGFTGDRAEMRIICDGKELNGKITDGKGKAISESPKLRAGTAGYTAFFGSANNGVNYSGCSIRFPLEKE